MSDATALIDALQAALSLQLLSRKRPLGDAVRVKRNSELTAVALRSKVDPRIGVAYSRPPDLPAHKAPVLCDNQPIMRPTRAEKLLRTSHSTRFIELATCYFDGLRTVFRAGERRARFVASSDFSADKATSGSRAPRTIRGSRAANSSFHDCRRRRRRLNSVP